MSKIKLKLCQAYTLYNVNMIFSAYYLNNKLLIFRSNYFKYLGNAYSHVGL